MKRILFVCHGNICRSPMAEFVMKDLLRQSGRVMEVFSAATSRDELGSPIYPPASRTLHAHGVPTQPRAARQLRPEDYEEFDHILVMDTANVRNTLGLFDGDPQGKVLRLLDITDDPRDISDPWYTGGFEQTYADVVKGCQALLAQLDSADK